MHDRRRSSRLKSLEDKKDDLGTPTQEQNNLEGSQPSSPMALEGKDHLPHENGNTNGTTSNGILKPHKSSKLKKSKKHKDKDKEKRKSKKKSKSRPINSGSSSEENNGGNFRKTGSSIHTLNGDELSLNSKDCFTPPLPPNNPVFMLKSSSTSSSSSLNAGQSGSAMEGGNSSDSGESPKPVKPKHRWRRNSELESGHRPGGEQQQTSTLINTLQEYSINGDSSSSCVEKMPLGAFNEALMNGGGMAPATHSPSLAVTSNHHTPYIPKEIEPVPPFQRIEENEYLFDR